MSIDALPGSIRRRTARGGVLLAALMQAALATALSTGCALAVRAQAMVAGNSPGLKSGVDASVKPGDDFFAYANGSWLKATRLPAGTQRWGSRDEINAIVSRRVAALLDSARTAPPGTEARKVADFRAAYLNEPAIEARGLVPLKPLLDSIDRVQDKTSLTRLLGSGLRADIDSLNWAVYKSSHPLGLSVTKGNYGEKNYIAFLMQGGLGLPDRENYVSTESALQSLRARYKEHVSKQLTLAGFDGADKRAESVMALETALALSQDTREVSNNDHNGINVWTRADFAQKAPGMDWSAYFDAAGLGKVQTFVAWQPKAVTGFAALVASQPLETWKDYLRFHAVEENADVLPRAIADEALAMRAAEAGGAPPPVSRSQRALDATQAALGEAIGRMYAEHYFPPEQKARVKAIVTNVAAEFARRVEAVTWMSPASKKIALAKLKVLYLGIGYPERWQDYSDLVVDPADALGNARRVSQWRVRHAIDRIGQPVDDKVWLIAPQPAGAILGFQQNAYEFSAALLQPPKFDPQQSDVATYGAIGALMGHDVTHFVDELGAEYDVNGGLRHWWTNEDSLHFEALAEPLDKQFAAYHPLPDLAVNGKLTQSENIADLGGLTAAFDAYRRSLGARVNDKKYVREHDREFFIAFAQTFRTIMSDSATRAWVATNTHAPEGYRVATVRNLDAWYDAFDVRPGQRLYLEPRARVRIW